MWQGEAKGGGRGGIVGGGATGRVGGVGLLLSPARLDATLLVAAPARAK